jgi:crotonobetainyl-CoA:carnitine CoA-transferase CaiB-like acyl-CoA transferase
MGPGGSGGGNEGELSQDPERSTSMKPLSGIRVIDLTQILQGPYCAFLMAMAD